MESRDTNLDSLRGQLRILEARGAAEHQIAEVRRQIAAASPPAQREYSVADIALAQRRQAEAEFKRLYGDIEAEEAARAAAEDQQRAELRRHLEGQIDPALVTDLANAGQAVAAARQAVEAARQRLQQHASTPPAMLGNVTAWAKTKGQLEDEVSGYASVLAAREQDHQRAADRHRQALDAAWRGEASAAAATLARVTAEGQAQIQAAEHALGEARRAAGQAEYNARQRLNFLEQRRPA